MLSATSPRSGLLRQERQQAAAVHGAFARSARLSAASERVWRSQVAPALSKRFSPTERAAYRHTRSTVLSERHWAKRPVSSYVFVSNWGNQLDVGAIHRAFYAVSRQIGLRGPADSHGPRLHDLRHRFAVTTLWRWYRAVEDAERRLPILSTYLGHVHVSDTFWYLSAWPELMREAMRRLEGRWEARS